MQDAVSVVLCNSVAIAESLISNLDLRPALSMPLSTGLSALRGRTWSSGCPALAVLVETDARTLAGAARALKRRWPDIRVLAVGAPNTEDSILRCFAAGADGMVLPDESLEQLRGAVRDVVAGRFRPPPAKNLQPLFSRLIRLQPAGGSNEAPRFAALSRREKEVLALLRRGESNKEIAVHLHLEVQTIKNHVSAILRKLGVRTRFDAPRVAPGDEGDLP
jgi:DNA-binding NarL/FixJ family response regulator